MPTRKELGAELNLEEDLIPVLNSNRPGRLMTPDKITIHETDNTNSGAGALAHAYYMKGEEARKRQVSWHYTVDDKMCIKSVPINEIAWHAASAEGNSRSIGIEICVNVDSNKKNADERAAKLVAVLMYDLGISIENVVTHNYWSGKNCPRNLLDNGRPGAKWQKFLDNVTKKLDSITPIAPPGASDPFAGIGGDTSGHEDEIPPPGGATQPGGINLNVPYLSQADNWIAPLSTCGPTSVAMCLLYVGIRGSGNGQFEDEIKRLSDSKGWDHGATGGLRRIVEYYGARDDLTETASLEDIDKALNSNKVCIIHGFFTRPGHILVVRGYTNSGDYYVNDPAGEWYYDGYDYNRTGTNDQKGKNLVYSRRLISAAANASYSLQEAKNNYKNWSNDQIENTSTIWLHRISK